MVGLIPTSTDDGVGLDQWLLGPEAILTVMNGVSWVFPVSANGTDWDIWTDSGGTAAPPQRSGLDRGCQPCQSCPLLNPSQKLCSKERWTRFAVIADS